jgi:hypothetical protein
VLSDIQRITVESAHTGLQANELLLVCAYDDDEKYRQYSLEGSISLPTFRLQLDSLEKNQEIVFYCA